MTTLLDAFETPPPRAAAPAPAEAPSSTEPSAPARRLQSEMAASRVQFTWLGTRKALTPDQRALAAEAFDADGPFLSAGKKLLDTRHEAFRAVTAVRGRIGAYWRGISLPYPEPGVRLIRRDGLEEFVATLATFKAELAQAVQALGHHYYEL